MSKVVEIAIPILGVSLIYALTFAWWDAKTFLTKYKIGEENGKS